MRKVRVKRRLGKPLRREQRDARYAHNQYRQSPVHNRASNTDLFTVSYDNQRPFNCN